MENKKFSRRRKSRRSRVNITSNPSKIRAFKTSNKTNISDKMKEEKKKNIIIRIIVFIVIIILIVFGLTKIIGNKPKQENDNLIYNKNKSFTKEQKIEGIKIKNIKCTFDGNNSLISYIIVNETNKNIYLKNYDIIVKNKDKKALTKIVASYDQDIPPKEEIGLANSVVGKDLTNAYYMELKLKTESK